MSPKGIGGRPAIYAPKDGDRQMRVGKLTAKGQRLFDAARGQLKKITGWVGHVSDGDVIEWTIRGKKRPPPRK